MQRKFPPARNFQLIVLALACIAAGLTGCNTGPAIVPVSGVVKMNGEPLTGVEGFVRVEPADFRAATGKINPEDGTFELTTRTPGDGCVKGRHPTAVIVNVSVGPRLISLIPEEYAESARSGLFTNIEGATGSLVINLQGKLKKAPAAGSDIFQGDDPGFVE